MRLYAILIIAAIGCLVQAKCPNNCNNNGECDAYSRCHCAKGYQGADCSERICPFGTAWADHATATDVAHGIAECSNRGICDRETGNCQCMSGFTGSSCDRLACPSSCNERGVCMSLHDYADKKR